MADPAEREERVWAELKETKAELKAAQARLLDEVSKPAEQQNAKLIANLEKFIANLSAQWTALNADFQQLLAAAGISGMHLPRNSCRQLCVEPRCLGSPPSLLRIFGINFWTRS